MGRGRDGSEVGFELPGNLLINSFIKFDFF